MEAYNIKSNEWFHVAPMNTRRSSVGVGVVGGRCCRFLLVNSARYTGHCLIARSDSPHHQNTHLLSGETNGHLRRESRSCYKILITLFLKLACLYKQTCIRPSFLCFLPLLLPLSLLFLCLLSSFLFLCFTLQVLPM